MRRIDSRSPGRGTNRGLWAVLTISALLMAYAPPASAAGGPAVPEPERPRGLQPPASPTAAAERPTDRGAPGGTRLHRTGQWAYWQLLATGVLLGGSWLAIPAPDSCRWCGMNGLDEGVRDLLLASNPSSADSWSNFTAYLLTPVAALSTLAVQPLLGRRYLEILENVVMVLNAVGATLLLTDLTKKAVGRQRPRVAHRSAVQSPTHGREDNLSFYSGHTSLAFSIAASAATVAFLRRYRAAPHFAVVGGLSALATGLLRIAADAHWATDVMVGMVVGTAIGVLMPYLLHGRAGGPVAISVGPTAVGRGARLFAAFAW